MKKHSILFLFLLLGALNSNAQVTFQPGFRAGFNFSDLTESNGSFNTDFYAGGLLAINLAKRYTLQPEIIYSRQGADNVDTYLYDPNSDTYRRGETDVNLDYLSICMMNKFNIANGFHITVGPTLDVLVDTNMRYSQSDIDLAVVTGFGYKFPSGLALEFRFKKGIADVIGGDDFYQEDDDYLFGDYNTNFLFQVGAAYYFDIKQK
jgi:hypothetical protein